jgi:glyoxylase-like metal-dependent hydrolase (beta-lactamase superfamily II)
MVETNCYLLHNEESGEAVLIDPGDQGRELLSLLEREKMTLKAILLTHGHFDHMLAVPVLREATKAVVYAAAAETKLLKDTAMNLTSGSRQMAAGWRNLYRSRLSDADDPDAGPYGR